MINFKAIVSTSFYKNVVVLVTGTAFSQLLTFMFTPFITRLFGPEEFGIAGLFIAIANIIISFSALCLPMAIILPKSPKEATSVARLSVGICYLVSFALFVFILFFHDLIGSEFNLAFDSTFLFLLPIICVCAGFQQVSEKWLQRKNMFHLIAKILVLQTIIAIIIKLTGGFYLSEHPVLIIAFTLALILNSILSTKFSGLKLSEIATLKSNFIDTQLLKKYHDFPLFRCPQVVSFGLTQGVPIIVFSTYYGAQSAGYFALSIAMLAAPANLISKAVGDVIYPKFAELFNNGVNIQSHIGKVTLCLVAIGLIPLVIFMLFAPQLFEIVFGNEWEMAGVYASWLSLSYFAGFINAPVVQAIPILKLQKKFFIYSMVVTVLRVALLYALAILDFSAIDVIKAYSLLGAILGASIIAYVYMSSSNKNQEKN